jgi:hypothetical protein
LIAKNNFCASPLRTALGAWVGVPVEFAPDGPSNQVVGGFFFPLRFFPPHSLSAKLQTGARWGSRVRENTIAREAAF